MRETGIEHMRRLVSVAGWCHEATFDDFDVLQTIRLLEACLVLDLGTLPDQLTLGERKHAAKYGKLSKSAIKRLYRAEYGQRWEAALNGTDLALYNSL